MSDWKPIASAPENRELETKIDDGNGVRNVRKLTRKGNLWFTEPAGGMYVYYRPTHWRFPSQQHSAQGE